MVRDFFIKKVKNCWKSLQKKTHYLTNL